MKFKQHIEETMATLKDFQQATVDYVISRIRQGQRKFLIADEVGLGKTIVAKGIVAKLYEKQYSPLKDFRVVYICSNQALARQNLSKLNFIKDDKAEIIDYNDEDDRLTSLAYEPNATTSEYRLKIKALTPSTSFDNRRRAGRADERVLLYRLLMHIPGMQHRLISLKWFLRGGQQIGEATWVYKTEEAFRYENGQTTNEYVRPIRSEVYKNFKIRLRQRLSDVNQKKIFGNVRDNRSVLDGLFNLLEKNKQNRSFENGRDKVFKDYYSLIAELRLHLAHVCKNYLKGDLFILDEFQKFSQLIQQDETDNKGEEIARVIFSDPAARVLLLSATPFKPYTNSFDEQNGEVHYKEFQRVLKFLYPAKNTAFWHGLEEKNREFFQSIKTFSESLNGIDILSLKNEIQKVYRQCMVRTERTLVENSEDTVNVNSIRFLQLQPDDIYDFIALDEIIVAANQIADEKLSHAIEYVKSAPFPLSFLQDYDHHKILRKITTEDNRLQKLLRQSKRAFVPVERIRSYKALLPERSINEPNPKLRLLYDETVRNNGYRLLWIPPSIKYYQTKGGPYQNADDFSKTLIFSAWKMVPKMVSALVSYEAERLSIGKLFDQVSEEKYSYSDKKRYPYPLLTFRRTETGLSGMNNMMLAYPCMYLSSLYHPALNLVERKDLNKIRSQLKRIIISRLKELDILSIGTKGGNLQKWDWFAVLLLEKNHTESPAIIDWLNDSRTDTLFDGENDTDNKEHDTHKSAKQIHFQEIRNYLTRDIVPDIGRIKPDQLDRISEHLVSLCLGGPGICAFRSIRQTYPDAELSEVLNGALETGLGMISMFNKPESIAVVKVAEDETAYHENVLNYAIDGHIQAMFDEFLYQLKDSGGYSTCRKACDLIRNILMVGASKVDVMTADSIQDNNHFSMRTHYAVPFGTSENNDLKNGKRQIKVREAFNSPFRPFVLTSTSIGQEGLDFHFYCKKIIHWNLPHNPIDMEQREGRIKRYKSLLVRRSVANLYQQHLTITHVQVNLWNALFYYASMEEKLCDLVPYWYVKAEKPYIDSIVPLYRYSKDIAKYHYIKKVLANYRLTFGQPDQQELIDVLALVNEGKREELRNLLISLSPITFETTDA